MPMYEKGSVRAEPRSKQQERMKKIMKKFLSSLLALTMILSLVIVPANAHDDPTVSPTSLTFEMTDKAALTKTATVTAPAGSSYSWESKNSTVATVSDASKTSATASITAVAAGTTTVECTITLPETPAQGSSESGEGNSSSSRAAQQTKVSVSITVNDKQAELATAVKTAKVTFYGREYQFNSSSVVTIQKFSGETLGDSLPINISGATLTKTGNQWTVTKGAQSVNVTVNTSDVNAGAFSVAVDKNTAVQGEKVTITPTYSAAAGGPVKYEYSMANGRASVTVDGKKTGAYEWTVPTNAATGTWTITCDVYEGDTKVATDSSKTVVVSENTRYAAAAANDSTSISLVAGESTSVKNPVIKDSANKEFSVAPDSVSWDLDRTSTTGSILYTKNSTGCSITALDKSGTAKLIATATYNGLTYKLTYTIKVTAPDATLTEITNGDNDSYSQSQLESNLADAINKVSSSRFSASDIDEVRYISSSSELTVKDGSTLRLNDKITGGLSIATKAGYIGETNIKFKVIDGVKEYTVTLYVPVVGDDKIDATVNGSTAKSDVSFKVSDAVDYSYLFVYGSSSTPSTTKPSDYDGLWTKTGTTASGKWEKYSSSSTVTVPSKNFSSGKATLYVVGLDSDGVASTGTITVSQKSYDINYNVVAGKSVTFNQKDFESFLEDYADDNGDYNSRKDELSFDHAVLTSSIPSAKSEGTLYYGSTEITSSNKSKTDMTDMDKVSFDSVSKPTKDTVTLTFKVYGDLYKNGSSRKTEVKYDVNVVISVVKEDITYTVGIDDTVQLTARDFVNFLQDAKTSYRKAELDYVKFDVSGKNVSSYAYGGLYRSYSSYSTGKLADSTDKFYYEPSRTQYDLADVAYHTTRWAEAGKTVYIPFTVYGTKGEEASGTMAITIAQTMNFIDVKASDFFYEPVKWAVNNKITNGTSSTTFSPYKNCNRAEIVTFLWRAAGSPEPTSTRNPFTDVNSVRDASYYKAILWASQKGITAGTTATTFSPYQECTRSQIVTFLYRYAGKPSGYYSNPFKDVSSVNEASYYNAILWAVGKGITQGTSTTTFSPYASCTRGEAVTFLYRYVNGVK